VKWVRTILVLSVLGVWLGATNHCRLEDLPALKFLACNPESEAPAHEDSDCDQDSCVAVEKSAYKTERGRVAAADPTMLLIPTLLPSLRDDAEFKPGLLDTLAIPELRVTWQFSLRTAAPPRAPSILV
jgi:hypothetical protein